ncbi:hypothetical protein BRADI_2g49777v3 [Brachypodium distachyon]|uniref:Uncharacterized protein n=1 Tax=Brachypodium distachyon TaxID=15368 RepID=A0A2K2DEY4_BRADI|nr:hypothetical protein BRADI_2g49777v3 [Brachypodium distachyon]
MDEFHEADILWPDTAPPSLQQHRDLEVLFVPPEILHELASSSSSGGAFCRSDQGAGASSAAEDDGEEWQEADVLCPETVHDFVVARAGRRPMKPGAASRIEGWSAAAASSPIDIPAKVGARCR